MKQHSFQLGDVVTEKQRHIPMKITYILPAKNSNNDYLSVNKYVCEWVERGQGRTKICPGTDLEPIGMLVKSNSNRLS